MSGSIYDWSLTAANNSNADGDINWLEGQPSSTVNDSARVMMQRVKQFIVDLGGSISAGGTANALTLTASSPFTALADGLIVSFRATATNTGAATLNVNSIGAKPIHKFGGAAIDADLFAGDLRNTGIYVAQYSAALNGGTGAWQLLNPSIVNSGNAAVTKTGNYTAVLSDAGRPILLSGAFTLSLTAAATLGDKWRISARNIGSGIVTVDPNSTELIDGASTVTMLPGQSCDIVCDGTAFYTVGLQAEVMSKFSASNQASLIIPVPTGFASHEIIVHSLLPQTTPAQLHMQISNDGGVTYIATSMAYNWSLVNSSASPSTALGGSNSDTKIQLTGTQVVSTFSAISGIIEFVNASTTPAYKRVSWKLGYLDSVAVQRIEGLGEIPTSAVITHIKLFHPSSVNIASASVTMRSKA